MSDMLSQEEIDALLKGDTFSIPTEDEDRIFSSEEIDALGEIGNICMGTSATTLSTLVGRKVTITTPAVSFTTWDELSKQYDMPYVAVEVKYTAGLLGSNLLIIKENDVKILTSLMVGGDGSDSDNELTDLHLSAISEVMNQMVGSSSTSMSSLFSKRIFISTPKVFNFNFSDDKPFSYIKENEKIVKIAFRMIVGNLIDSEIMVIMPEGFAKELVGSLLLTEPAGSLPKSDGPIGGKGPERHPERHPERQIEVNTRDDHAVRVQPAEFELFNEGNVQINKKNINLIMDVPLEITVELGRARKLIKDILEFSPGSIIELDKLAGEPVDILVNGKSIAKGEVVVIDESFGVRITDIIHPSKRL